MGNLEVLSQQVADSVYYNGKIYTVDKEYSIATAIAVKGQYLVYVGDDDGVKAYIGSNTNVINLKGNIMLPGMIDGHTHLAMFGQSTLRINISGKTKEEILAEIKKATREKKPGEWIESSWGWNNELWEDKSYPTKEELDEVAPNNPVILRRIDGHMIWVNSMALKLAGIIDDIENPQGGEYMRNEKGGLLGCCSDTANQPIFDAIPPMTDELRRKALLVAQEDLFSYGVTSVHDMHTEVETLNLLKELYEDESLDIRFSGAIKREPFDKDEKVVEYLKHCPEIDLYDHHFNCRSVKIIADGSVGSQSAAQLEDYSDRPGYRGALIYTDEEMYEMVRYAAEHGLRVITHAIGDETIEQTLRVYEKVLREFPIDDHRFRIEHFQLVTGDTRERAKKLGVVVSMQPLHGPANASMAERRLGPDRASRAYAFGLVLKVMGMIVGGSDCPVTPPRPLWGIHAAVNRTTPDGKPKGGFHPEHCVTREEAVRAYTNWAAYGEFSENIKGSLEVGKLADFVVIDRDIMTCPREQICNIRVLKTVVGGKNVYGE